MATKAALAGFKALVEAAHAAGLAAAAATTPVPMEIYTAHPLTGTAIPGTPTYTVAAGVCGFAGVKLTPATSAFAKYLKSLGNFRPSYTGGLDSYVTEFGQSLELKTAYAWAYAATLRAAGYTAYAWDRID